MGRPKGSIPWNKGKVGVQSHSEETRQQISRSLTGRVSPMKGRHHSSASRSKMSADRSGHVPYEMTDAIREKISATKTGRPLTDEHKAKLAATLRRGPDHHNWKGGVSSRNYQERRRFQRFYQGLVFQRDDYTCQNCQQEGGSLQVDHIKGWSSHPELRFDIGNCRTLCMACHYYVTFKRRLPRGVVWGHNLSRRVNP